MKIPVAEAARQLEERGLLTRFRHDQSERVIKRARELLGPDLPADLIDFYREHIAWIADFQSHVPVWNDWVGWKDDDILAELLHVDAAPLFGDGYGNIYGLDLRSRIATPAVYLFDHEREFEIESAAGSSLGAFMLLLADEDRAYAEGWPERWELDIDPDIETCPRARAIWAAD